jgi:hypothetical protein
MSVVTPSIIPPEPENPRGEALGDLRYEDIAQDGRVQLLALPQSIGLAVWSKLIERHEGAITAMRAGLIPILTKLVIEGEDTSLSVRRPFDMSGTFEMAHTVDERGEVNRIFVNMWTRTLGVIGRTYGPPPAGAGGKALVGRVFAEHTFTRLFAPPDQRRVTRLDVPGVEPVPPKLYREWTPPESLLELPAGATWLDDTLLPDEVTLAWGLVHTDSNQHVNSLVYPLAFEEAALRRFAARGKSTQVLARRLEVAYRKPMFAGERARVWLRAFVGADGQPGALGVFQPGSEAAEVGRANAFVRMSFG